MRAFVDSIFTNAGPENLRPIPPSMNENHFKNCYSSHLYMQRESGWLLRQILGVIEKRLDKGAKYGQYMQVLLGLLNNDCKGEAVWGSEYEFTRKYYIQMAELTFDEDGFPLGRCLPRSKWLKLPDNEKQACNSYSEIVPFDLYGL